MLGKIPEDIRVRHGVLTYPHFGGDLVLQIGYAGVAKEEIVPAAPVDDVGAGLGREGNDVDFLLHFPVSGHHFPVPVIGHDELAFASHVRADEVAGTVANGGDGIVAAATEDGVGHDDGDRRGIRLPVLRGVVVPDPVGELRRDGESRADRLDADGKVAFADDRPIAVDHDLPGRVEMISGVQRNRRAAREGRADRADGNRLRAVVVIQRHAVFRGGAGGLNHVADVDREMGFRIVRIVVKAQPRMREEQLRQRTGVFQKGSPIREQLAADGEGRGGVCAVAHDCSRDRERAGHDEGAAVHHGEVFDVGVACHVKEVADMRYAALTGTGFDGQVALDDGGAGKANVRRVARRSQGHIAVDQQDPVIEGIPCHVVAHVRASA